MVLTSSYHKMELPKYKLWNDPHLCLYLENVPLNVRHPWGLFVCNTKCHQNVFRHNFEIWPADYISAFAYCRKIDFSNFNIVTVE